MELVRRHIFLWVISREQFADRKGARPGGGGVKGHGRERAMGGEYRRKGKMGKEVWHGRESVEGEWETSRWRG